MRLLRHGPRVPIQPVRRINRISHVRRRLPSSSGRALGNLHGGEYQHTSTLWWLGSGCFRRRDICSRC